MRGPGVCSAFRKEGAGVQRVEQSRRVRTRGAGRHAEAWEPADTVPVPGSRAPSAGHIEGSTMSTNETPAGWYPAPHAGNEQRYWDGGKWIDTTPEQAQAAAEAFAATTVKPAAMRGAEALAPQSGGGPLA